MPTPPAATYSPRIYPLDPRHLTEEEIAVAFAMTSRRPEPFDEIAEQVSQEKAADFHERWVLGYGHASVAEHAVVHLAVENISRLACDSLEDNRLASYTEKSSRYQVMPKDYFHLPAELEKYPEARAAYLSTCQGLFAAYQRLVGGCMEYLRGELPRRQGERDGAYNLRLRRITTDVCRSVLPSATLTNVGLTANARVLEHAISKLMSSGLAEERAIGEQLREQGRVITPTLIKYADRNRYLEDSLQRDWQLGFPAGAGVSTGPSTTVNLVHYDPEAEEKLAAAVLFRQSSGDYAGAWEQSRAMDPEDRCQLIDSLMENLGDHDAPLREFELMDYTFEYIMDYGAYREFKRHRMQSYFPQALTVDLGYKTPELIAEAGLEEDFRRAMEDSEEGFRSVSRDAPLAAQYLVTHGHYRRVLSKLNLRECYHLFKLRSSSEAHESIREPILEAMRLAVEVHPHLFRWLKLRDYPNWWPFPAQ
ncbi:MAG: FAD-dependent thymidylate synthase [Chloroflexota bacterium]|nr:FAD-dependent thymidylate synthase [Chloroflexota bacterium]